MEENTTDQLGISIRLKTDYQTALTETIAALKVEGFGILTEIDVQDTFKKKLGADYPPYKILGACNPPLSHRALTAAPEVGLLLPCNVTVRQLADGMIEVAIIDPLMMMSVIDNPELKPIAAEARARLTQVSQSLKESHNR